MSKVVFVLAFLVANVYANDCDECVKSNRRWCLGQGCQDLGTAGERACPTRYANLNHIDVQPPVPGDLVHPASAQQILRANPLPDELTMIYYKSTEKQNVTFASYDKDIIMVSNKVIDEHLNDTHRTLVIKAKIKPGFCYHGTSSDIVVQVGDLGNSTQTILVQCSCQCTNEPEINATSCFHRGNSTCGVCSCDSEWAGNHCEISCLTRGDVPAPMRCENAPGYNGNAKVCNGNGRCLCSTCKCNNYVEGSQYLSPDYNCIDVCTATKPCRECLLSGTPGECNSCHRSGADEEFMPEFQFRIEELDEERLIDKFQNRNVWVHCNAVVEACTLDYYAMKEDNDQIYVAMVTNNTRCIISQAEAAGGGGAARSIVPLILGIVLALVAVAVIGAFLLWKHMHTLPAMPASNSQYANIEAEECRGENPLYKPPTSSFKNPTYGKYY